MRAAAFVAAAAACAPAAALAAGAPAAAAGPSVLFPWLCLERCGDDAAAIAAQVQQLTVNASLFTGAAFEQFNLGPNSTLVLNNLTRVSAAIAAAGVPQRYAMISSYPYPPQFLTWMREVFANPAPFIAACIAALKANPSLTGFNVDWEPQGGAGAPQPHRADALAYASFIDEFAMSLHAAGDYQLTVAVATWSPIWDLGALGKTSVDYIASMGTYTGNFTVWKAQLEDLLTAVPASKAVVGLETTNDVSVGRERKPGKRGGGGEGGGVAAPCPRVCHPECHVAQLITARRAALRRATHSRAHALPPLPLRRLPLPAPRVRAGRWRRAVYGRGAPGALRQPVERGGARGRHLALAHPRQLVAVPAGAAAAAPVLKMPVHVHPAAPVPRSRRGGHRCTCMHACARPRRIAHARDS